MPAVGARVPWVDMHDELRARISDALFEAPRGDVGTGSECAECGRPIGRTGRWYSHGTGLVPYCKGCAEVQFTAF